MNTQMKSELKEPMNLIKQSLGKEIYIKCRHNRELKGTLHGYDEHLNMMLSDVHETINNTDKKSFGLIYIRGDLVIMVSPIN